MSFLYQWFTRPADATPSGTPVAPPTSPKSDDVLAKTAPGGSSPTSTAPTVTVTTTTTTSTSSAASSSASSGRRGNVSGEGGDSAAPVVEVARPLSAAPKLFGHYKCLLVGDGATGKTTFVKRHMTGEFVKKYNPTLGVEVHSLVFDTNYGRFLFDVWDTAGQEKMGGLRDGYYVNGQCAIIMFDMNDTETWKNVPRWRRDVERVCGQIPTVICGNKADLLDEDKRKPTPRVPNNCTFIPVSSCFNWHAEKPFLWFCRKFYSTSPKASPSDAKLKFVEEPALVPPVHPPAVVDETRKQLDRMYQDAKNTPLPPNTVTSPSDDL
ncbi:GTP-binding nuclear protein Ran [Pelomyxa schiedti]|nr:GTP-binding nuclear protein Ran [Pelomyxa schiedti]